MTGFLHLLAENDIAPLSVDLFNNFGAMLPEYFLCGMVVVMLLVDLIQGKGGNPKYPWLTFGGILVAFLLVVLGGDGATVVGYDAFGALHVDGLARIFKMIFLATGALTVLFIARSGQKYAHEGEFHVLMFGALAGMCFLASANDLITFYLSFEMVSYTGFMMAGYRLESTRSAEAAGKYVIFGSVASAVMLYGLSLVYGFTGSTQFGEIASQLVAAEVQPALAVGAILVFAGFAFKAAAFPFQFWCPDVYEGAPAPIAGFLAVASKAAAFAVGIRVLGHGFEALPVGLGLKQGVFGHKWELIDVAARYTHLFNPDASFVQNMLIVASIGTMTWGNLAALRQTNLQRMLAYSSIAHAGYLLMTCVVVGRDAGTIPGQIGQDAIIAIVFYLVLYLFMNLGAFFIVTLMRRDMQSAEISSLRGLGGRHPFLAFCFAIMLFSLTGLPPTAGFLGKFMLFAPVINNGLYLLALAGLLNGAVSLYYYAKPLKELYLTDREDDSAPVFRLGNADLALIGALTAPLLFLIVFGWQGFVDFAGTAVAMVQ